MERGRAEESDEGTERRKEQSSEVRGRRARNPQAPSLSPGLERIVAELCDDDVQLLVRCVAMSSCTLAVARIAHPPRRPSSQSSVSRPIQSSCYLIPIPLPHHVQVRPPRVHRRELEECLPIPYPCGNAASQSALLLHPLTCSLSLLSCSILSLFFRTAPSRASRRW
jgi:hypothetical protein